jgi:hypothetical protein
VALVELSGQTLEVVAGEREAVLARVEDLSGDGGNRTHVRGRVLGSFYERSRRSISRLPIAAPAGLRETSPLRVPAPPRALGAGLAC